ncbi:MAG: hypothetical protein V4694_00885 [Pseudomonadota bacterium]
MINFKRLDISSVVEIYCNLIKSSEELDFLNQIVTYKNWQNISYIGLNPDKKIISNNRNFFRLDKEKFFSQLDATNDPLPRCDLVILNNFFADLSHKNIWFLLSNIKESGAKYLLIERNSSAINLHDEPFYLPQSDVVTSIKKSDKFYDVYDLRKIAFLLDYLPQEDSFLRAKIYEYINSDFAILKTILGELKFKELLISFKCGWQKNTDFINRQEINDLLWQNNCLGHEICGFYFRILNQSEINLVTARSGFIDEKNFYKIYLVLNNYLNFCLLDQIYKI